MGEPDAAADKQPVPTLTPSRGAQTTHRAYHGKSVNNQSPLSHHLEELKQLIEPTMVWGLVVYLPW